MREEIDGMFEDVGAKIKGLAKCVCWVGIACSVLGGIATFASSRGNAVTGVVAIVIVAAGGLGSWIGSMMVYALGELVENSTAQATRTYQLLEEMKKMNARGGGVQYASAPAATASGALNKSNDISSFRMSDL